MKDILLRFLIGGAVVSAFALIADILKPKSFAGLFGAAPSVALATLVLTIQHDGKGYAAVELRSMMAGAVGFLVYACVVSRRMIKGGISAKRATTTLLPIWFAVSFGLYLLGHVLL